MEPGDKKKYWVKGLSMNNLQLIGASMIPTTERKSDELKFSSVQKVQHLDIAG